MTKWIGSKPRLVILNRKDMVSKADMAAWDKYYAAEALQAAEAAAAARQRSAARAAAKAAAAEGSPGIVQQQHQVGSEEGADLQQQEQHEELQPPSLPQQVLWTDGKTGRLGYVCNPASCFV